MVSSSRRKINNAKISDAKEPPPFLSLNKDFHNSPAPKPEAIKVFIFEY